MEIKTTRSTAKRPRASKPIATTASVRQGELFLLDSIHGLAVGRAAAEASERWGLAPVLAQRFDRLRADGACACSSPLRCCTHRRCCYATNRARASTR